MKFPVILTAVADSPRSPEELTVVAVMALLVIVGALRVPEMEASDNYASSPINFTAVIIYSYVIILTLYHH